MCGVCREYERRKNSLFYSFFGKFLEQKCHDTFISWFKFELYIFTVGLIRHDKVWSMWMW